MPSSFSYPLPGTLPDPKQWPLIYHLFEPVRLQTKKRAGRASVSHREAFFSSKPQNKLIYKHKYKISLEKGRKIGIFEAENGFFSPKNGQKKGGNNAFPPESGSNSSVLAFGFNPMYGDKITKKYTRNNSGFTFFVLYPTPPHRYFCRMELFDAIRRMRELSRKNETFSFSFMSYNSSAGRSEGIVEVRHARLRARAKETHHRHAEIIEEYIDIDTGRARHFYQPLLMSFNGEKVYA